MADVTGGRIIWRLEVDESKFDSQLASAEAKAKGFGTTLGTAGAKGFGGFAQEASSAFSTVADGLGTVLKYSLVAGTAIGFALGAAGKASFDTVKSVQSATLALKAYTGSAEAAGKITGELIAFAKSDQGVLFQRKDLLFAAQALAGYGAEASKVTDYVKIMSRAVATGNTTFEELAPILGRIGATGRLTSTDFDVLTARGIILDKSMRGAAVSFDTLFAAISKAIPASILDEQANTVSAAVIRLKTRFRELGDQLLGTKYGSVLSGLGAEFQAGGLGDTIVQGIKEITKAFASPEVTGAIAKFGNEVAGFAKRIVPLIGPAIQMVAKNLDTFAMAVGSVAAAFVTLKGIAAGFNLAALFLQAGAAGPFLLIAGAIALVVAGIVMLVTKMGLLEPVLRVLGSAAKVVFDGIKDAVNTVKDSLNEAFGNPNWSEVFKTALKAVGDAITFVAPIIANVIRFIGDFIATIVRIGTQVYNFLKPAIDVLAAAFSWLNNIVQTFVIPAFQYLWDKIQPFMPILEKLAMVVGVVLVGGFIIANLAMLLFVGVIAVVIAAVAYAVGWIINAIGWLWDKWNQYWGWIGEKVGNIWNGIKNVIAAAGDWVGNKIAELIAWVLRTWDKLQEIPGKVSSAFNNAVSAAAGFIGRFVQLGANIISGVIQGVSSAAGNLIGYIAGLFGDVVGIAKRILHIASPSRVFADIGMNIGLGLAEGIRSSTKDAVSATQDMARQVSGVGMGIVPPDIKASDIASYGATGGSAQGTTVHIEKIELSGIMTESRQGKREVAHDLVQALNEQLLAENKDIIPNTGGLRG